MRSLARRLEKGGVLSCSGISAAAQPFLAALLRHLFPQRPIVLVTEGLRTQESANQDLATWLAIEEMEREGKSEVRSPKSEVQDANAECRLHNAETSILNHASRITDHVSRFTLHVSF